MMGNGMRMLIAAAVLAGSAAGAEAQTGPYIQMDLGAAIAPPLAVQGSDNDWSTKCDLIINPRGVETAAGECAAAPPPSAWTNEFDGGTGVSAGIAFGYDWGTFRLEGEYFHRVTVYDDSAGMDIFDNVSQDKREQEIELAAGTVDALRSHNFFANAYYDFGPASSSWIPYVGAGIGVERATLDYATVWKRNDDPARIATFMDPLLRARLAGTTTVGDARLTDIMVGYQVVGGVDYRLSDPVTLGVKVRWADFGEFMSDRVPWDQLRSHESSTGRGDTIDYYVKTDDSKFWGVSLSLKYRF